MQSLDILFAKLFFLQHMQNVYEGEMCVHKDSEKANITHLTFAYVYILVRNVAKKKVWKINVIAHCCEMFTAIYFKFSTLDIMYETYTFKKIQKRITYNDVHWTCCSLESPESRKCSSVVNIVKDFRVIRKITTFCGTQLKAYALSIKLYRVKFCKTKSFT